MDGTVAMLSLSPAGCTKGGNEIYHV